MIFFRKVLCTFLLALSVSLGFSQNNGELERLQITPNGHFLQYESGKPFFWLGDTAWELFHRLSKEEIEKYLENRQEKGFNVIQAVILAEMDGLVVPNEYGEVPFHQLDPEMPNEGYFQLVDWVVQNAQDKNMFIGLLPTWGDKVSKFWGVGPEVFNEENAYNYGLFLGERYKDYPNIIWIAGGDRPATNDKDNWKPIWKSMMKGINKGTEGKALITYHPWGGASSSDFWKDEKLLDITMMQSGHGKRDFPVWEKIRKDFNATPVKPVLDGEPNYEDHPVNWNLENGYFRDYDVRKQLYRSVFSGAAGVTYGHHSIWQMYNDKHQKVAFADRYWIEAMDRPGAFHAGYLKELILSRPSLKRLPDQSIIVEGQGKDGEYITAFRDEDGSYMMIYLPVGKQILVDVSVIKSKNITGWWFNPRTGKSQKINRLEKKDQIQFQPPTTGVRNDWVLILDNADKQYITPGVI